MCQTGINTADYKLAIHQLCELSKLVKTNADQWSKLAGAMQEHNLAGTLGSAGDKMAEVVTLLEAAFEAVHEHDHGHGHVHIS